MLQINLSLLIQMGNFLLLVFLLNIFLYRPIRRIIAQRSEQMSTLEHTIEDYQGKAEKDEIGIRENMARAQKEGYQEKESLKMQGLEEEKGILQEAGTVAEKKISGAKSEMEIQMGEVRKALEEQVAVFSKELAEKILGRSVQ